MIDIDTTGPSATMDSGVCDSTAPAAAKHAARGGCTVRAVVTTRSASYSRISRWGDETTMLPAAELGISSNECHLRSVQCSAE